MHPILTILGILILFLLMGRLADVVVRSARALGTQLGIGTFFLGVLLGLFTSAPEATIAVNAAAQQAPELSIGNCIGGTVVLLGLIAGLLALRNRTLPVREGVSGLVTAAVYLLFPVLFMQDGVLTVSEGLLLAFGYIGTLVLVYGASRKKWFSAPRIQLQSHAGLEILLLLAATAGIAIAAGLIVRLTIPLALAFGVPELMIGMLAYAVGTNLPEIFVALRASRMPDALPVATLLGSALANPFIIGLLAIGSDAPIRVPSGFLGSALSYTLVVLLFFLCARTGRTLTRKEGFVLLVAYAIFVYFGTQFI